MHDAEGLEFRAVAVMACDGDALPDSARLAGIADIADMEGPMKRSGIYCMWPGLVLETACPLTASRPDLNPLMTSGNGLGDPPALF